MHYLTLLPLAAVLALTLLSYRVGPRKMERMLSTIAGDNTGFDEYAARLARAANPYN